MTNTRPDETPSRDGVRTLAIDVGGTGLKAAVIDAAGTLLTDRVRTDTPVGAPPEKIIEVLTRLVAPLGAYERVAVGFPGVVRKGRVLTAPNLGNDRWNGHDLAGNLGRALGRPVRVANDADLQGMAVIAGNGVEMVVTLGTGFGTGIYLDGRLGPHLELSHHPFRNGETYDQQLGNAARQEIGNRRWTKRVMKAIVNIRILTKFDHLYLGGGNAKKLDLPLDPDVTIISNEAGIRGGVALWRD